ncbi:MULTISPECIES: hypothetical protein [Chitinophaga]|nr:hypothetical protein [Chitinophaga varians]
MKNYIPEPPPLLPDSGQNTARTAMTDSSSTGTFLSLYTTLNNK